MPKARVFGLLAAQAWALLALLAVANSAVAKPDVKRFLGKSVPTQEPADRGIDITKMQLDVTIDPHRRTVEGKVTWLGTVKRPGAQLLLNAKDLDIRSGAWLKDGQRTPVSIAVDDQKIRLRPPEAKAGSHFTLEITYKAQPKQGVYFVGPDKDEPDRPLHVHTQGEAIEARHWIPSPDNPDERFTWHVAVTMPRKFVVLSNGTKMGEQVKGKAKTTRYEMMLPMPIYLLSIAAGPFVETVHAKKESGVRVSTWSFAHEASRVKHSGRFLPGMLRFFNKKTGFEYGPGTYGQVFVHEFNSGGMENYTLTTLTHRAMGDRRSDLDRTIDGLLAHELAHQWFGDLVTCRTWGDIWLNESFATYFQKLWTEHHEGVERFAEQMHGARWSSIRTDDDRYLRPIVSDRYRAPDELFDTNSYPKGAWVLHMLRHELGEATFFAGITAYLRKHAYQSVETNDLRRALEQASGRSLRGFFQRWLREAGHPKVTAKIRWKGQQKRLHVDFEQTQRVTRQMPLYRLPIEVAVRKKGSKVAQIHKVVLKGKRASLSIPAPTRPEVVEIDPGMKLLVDWKLKAGPDVLAAAARWGRHPDVRLRATEALKHGGLRSANAVKALEAILADDKARHVRAAAARVLGGGRRDQVREPLLKALQDDKESMVRIAAARALGRLLDPAAVAALSKAAEDDKSYGVQVAALGSVVAIERDKARPLLVKAAGWKSYRHQVQLAALRLLATLGDAADLPRIRAAAAEGQPKSLRAGAAYALATLASRLDARPLKDQARADLEAMLHSPTLRIRHAAAQALGILGDPRSRRALQAAADREQTNRWAERIRSVTGQLGKSMTTNQRLKRLEERLHDLQRKGRDEQKKR